MLEACTAAVLAVLCGMALGLLLRWCMVLGLSVVPIDGRLC